MNILAFDIETIPDIEGGQAIFNLQGLDDKSTAKAIMHMHQQKTGSDFLPLHLHKIIAISIVCRGMGDDMEKLAALKSLGDESSSEADLLKLFFEEIDARAPQLVSWNGSGFDLPVIRYRALKNSVSLPSYWQDGNYHHNDLKLILSSYDLNDHAASLDHIAKLLGFPGKMGMDGSFALTDKGSVWDEYQAGNLKNIRNYCETDVLNTYLVYLRYQLMQGEIDHGELEKEFNLLREVLDNDGAKQGKEYLLSFSKHWA